MGRTGQEGARWKYRNLKEKKERSDQKGTYAKGDAKFLFIYLHMEDDKVKTGGSEDGQRKIRRKYMNLKEKKKKKRWAEGELKQKLMLCKIPAQLFT